MTIDLSIIIDPISFDLFICLYHNITTIDRLADVVAEAMRIELQESHLSLRAQETIPYAAWPRMPWMFASNIGFLRRKL